MQRSVGSSSRLTKRGIAMGGLDEDDEPLLGNWQDLNKMVAEHEEAPVNEAPTKSAGWRPLTTNFANEVEGSWTTRPKKKKK